MMCSCNAVSDCNTFDDKMICNTDMGRCMCMPGYVYRRLNHRCVMGAHEFLNLHCTHLRWVARLRFSSQSLSSRKPT